MGVATLNRTVNRLNLTMNGLGGQASAAFVRGLGPAAWFRFNTGITVTGSGVSQWDDQSGNGRHLKQGTDTNRPALQADGSILFDGVDNSLVCDAFTLVQPETVYILAKQVTWTLTEQIFDGNGVGSMLMRQSATTPGIRLTANNSVNQTTQNDGWTVNTYAAVAAVFNGASSVIQVNNATPTTGDCGAGDAGGFILARGTGNIQVKEAIVFATAHAANIRQRVIRYLSRVGNLGV